MEWALEVALEKVRNLATGRPRIGRIAQLLAGDPIAFQKSGVFFLPSAQETIVVGVVRFFLTGHGSSFCSLSPVYVSPSILR